MSEESRGTLKDGEPHPAFRSALYWYSKQNWNDLCMWQESFSSFAIKGNRLAEICSETLKRMMTGQPVSDRYFLGLCWIMRYGSIKKKRDKKRK